jgi:hypothetical protein
MFLEKAKARLLGLSLIIIIFFTVNDKFVSDFSNL